MFFRTALLGPGGYHPQSGGMLLHDAVVINSKKGAATENQGTGVMYVGFGVYIDDSYLVDGESRGLLLFITHKLNLS